MGNVESTLDPNHYVIDKLVYVLEDGRQGAELVNNIGASGEIIIPRIVTIEKAQRYVTRISQGSFKGSDTIQSIKMPINSELKKIEKGAFSNSKIESILIPPSVCELEDGWCANTPNLTKVSVLPQNKCYIYLEQKMVVGKTDRKSDDYDDLIFVNRDIESISIPSFIKRIAPYAFADSKIESVFIPHHITEICDHAFENCYHLYKVEFQSNSDIKYIGKNAFPENLIDNITFPPNFSNNKEQSSESNEEEEKNNKSNDEEERDSKSNGEEEKDNESNEEEEEKDSKSNDEDGSNKSNDEEESNKSNDEDGSNKSNDEEESNKSNDDEEKDSKSNEEEGSYKSNGEEEKK